MALYRNIAGIEKIGFDEFSKAGSVGMTLYSPTGSFTYTSDTPLPIRDIFAEPVDPSIRFNQYMDQQRQRYDYAMSRTAGELASEGIVVTTDNGSLFKDNVAWLPIQDVQYIENERGTAGALLMHMNEVQLAVDTAGYEGGGSGSGGSTQVTNPIPEVPAPEILTPGTPELEPTPISDIPAPTTDIPAPPIIPRSQTGSALINPFTIIGAGGLVFTLMKGKELKERKILLLGSVAALAYGLLRK